jgi:hypothetical protein
MLFVMGSLDKLKPGTAYFAAVLIFSALSIIGIQVLFFPSLKSCMLSSLSTLGTSIHLNAQLASTALGCISKPLLALLIFPALFFLSLLNRGFFRRFSSLVEWASSSNLRAAFFIATLLAVVTSFYLAPGEVLLGDASGFQTTVYSYYNNLLSGSMPFFSFDFFGGSVFFYYYGILYFFIAGAANLLFHNVDITAKLMLWLLHIASGVAFYFVARRFAKGNAAICASLLYALAFEHVGQIMITGRFLDAMQYVLLPLAVLLVEKQLAGEIGFLRGSALFSIVVTLVFLLSPADAVYIVFLLGIYSFVRLLQARSRRLFLSFALAAGIFLLLTAFWVFPFFIEKAYVNGTARVLNEIKPDLQLQLLSRMLMWPGYWGQSRVFYVPLTALALSLAAVIFWKKDSAVKASAFAAALAFAFVIGISGRAGTPFVFFTCLLAAFGAQALFSAKVLPFAPKAVAALLFVAILIDVLPAIIQPAYTDFSYEKSLIGSSKIDGGRILDLQTTFRTYYPNIAYLATGTPVVFGPLPEGAPRSFNYMAAVSCLAAHEAYDLKSTLSETSINGLYLFDAGYLIMHGEHVGADPLAEFISKRSSFGLERNLSVVHLKHSPIIVASRIERITPAAHMENTESYFTKQQFNRRELNWSYTSGIIDAMNISIGDNNAGVIFVRDADNAVIGSESKPTVRVVNFEASPTSVAMVVESSADAFARLSYSYFPWVDVYVNGQKAEVYQTEFSFMAIKLGKGESTIELRSSLSSSQKLFGIISILAAVLVIALLLIRPAGRHNL